MKNAPSKCASEGMYLNLARALASWLLLGTCACVNAEVVLKEQRRDVVAQVEIDRKTVALSGEIILTITVDGPSRLEVAPPQPLLTKSSAQAWSVKEMSLPVVENRDRGQQRWTMTFRLRPFVRGPAIEIALAPLKVKAGNALEAEMTWSKTAEIEVTTLIEDAGAQLLRPITDVEAAPAAPLGNASELRRWLIVLVVLIGAVATLALVAVLARRGGVAASAAVHDSIWAHSEFAKIIPTISERSAAYERLSEIIRLYLNLRFKLPATHLTTTEIFVSHDIISRLALQPLAHLRMILDRCDVVKFAAETSEMNDLDDLVGCIELANRFIAEVASSEGSPISNRAEA